MCMSAPHGGAARSAGYLSVGRLPVAGIGPLTANKWRVDIEFRHGAMQRIPIIWTPCHFGGSRPWFRCGRCGQRVGKFYSTGVALHCRCCLACGTLAQRRGAKSRRYLQALKLRLRLNGIANLREPFPRPTRSTCTARLMLVCAVWASGLSKTYAVILAFGIGKRITDLWCPNDLGTTCLLRNQQRNDGNFYRLALRLRTFQQRDQTLTGGSPIPNLSKI